MIKDFETYINEDYFSKLANRKDTGNRRIEDKLFGNIDEMKPIPFNTKLSGTIMVSDRILEFNGVNHFSYNDLVDANLGEWRIPTYEDMVSITSCNWDYGKENGKEIIKFNNGYKLYAYGFVNCGESTYLDSSNQIKTEKNRIVDEDNIGTYLVYPSKRDVSWNMFHMFKFGDEFKDGNKIAFIADVSSQWEEKYKYSIILVKNK